MESLVFEVSIKDKENQKEIIRDLEERGYTVSYDTINIEPQDFEAYVNFFDLDV